MGFAQALLERAEHVCELVTPFNRPATSSRIDEHFSEVRADVTISGLDTVCSAGPLLFNRVSGSAELLHHALGESVNGLVCVDLVFRDHGLDFGAGLAESLTDDLSRVNTALAQLDQILAGDLPGGLDLGDHERKVCELLRAATGGGHGVLHRVEQRDDLFNLDTESDQLLLRADKRRFAKRRVLGELAELLHLLVDGLLAAEHGFKGRVRVLLHGVVRQAGADRVLAQGGHAYRGCIGCSCGHLQGCLGAAAHGVEHAVNHSALGLHVCGETLSAAGGRVHPGCEPFVVHRDFCDQGSEVKLAHTFRLSLFGLTRWWEEPGEAAFRNVE